MSRPVTAPPGTTEPTKRSAMDGNGLSALRSNPHCAHLTAQMMRTRKTPPAAHARKSGTS